MFKKFFPYILSLFILASSSLFVWSLYYGFDYGFNGDGWQKYWLPGIFAVLTGFFSGFGWLLADSKRLSLAFSLAAILPSLLFFWNRPYILSLCLLAGLLFFIAHSHGLREKDASFKISIRKIFSASLPTFFMGLAILISVFYYLGNVNLLEEGRFRPFGENKATGAVGNFILDVVMGPEAKNLSLDLSVDDFIFQMLVQQQQIDAKTLSDKRVRQQLDRQITSFKQQLQQDYGLELTGQERVSAVINVFINDKIKSLFGPQQKYLPLVFAIAIFLVLRTLAFLYVWVTMVFVWAAYKLLLKFGIAAVEKKMTEKEAILIK